MLNRSERCCRKFTFKVREGRRAADFPELCVFLNNTAISKHIKTCYTSN